MSDDTRPFPSQQTYDTRPRCKASTIPWWLAEVAYAEYSRRYGTGQSLERLAERGGFGRDELLMLLSKGEETRKQHLCTHCRQAIPIGKAVVHPNGFQWYHDECWMIVGELVT